MKYRKVVFSIAALTLSTLSGVAQTTWHGLTFGMNRSEVTTALADYKLIQSNEAMGNYTILESTSDYLLKIGGSASLPFIIHVQFDALNRLEAIRLILDTKAMINSGRFKDDDMAVSVVSDILADEFIGKYGQPTKLDGHCVNSGEAYADWKTFQKHAFCARSWRADQQRVDYFWSLGLNGVSDLNIVYAALSDI